MSYLFLWLALVIAVVDWVAVAKEWKPLDYFAKPGVMVAAPDLAVANERDARPIESGSRPAWSSRWPVTCS